MVKSTTFIFTALLWASQALAVLQPVPISPVSLSASPGVTTNKDYDIGSGTGSAAYSYVISNLGAGKSAYTRVQLRKKGSTYYSAVARTTNGGTDWLQIERVINGVTTIVGDLTLGTTPVGNTRTLSLSVSDVSGTVKLTAVANGKTLSYTDNTAQKIAAAGANGFGISLYLQSTATAAVTIAYSAFNVKADLPEGYLPGWGAPTFEDTFSGTAVDASKWRVRNNDYVDYDSSVILASNVKVTGGNLILSTNRLSSPTIFGDQKPRWYSGAYIDTIGKYSQRYGRWEYRAKLPTIKNNSRGVWPAFWLRPDDTPPNGAEIDILEAYGTPVMDGKPTTPLTRTETSVHFQWSPSVKKNSFTQTGVDVNDGNFHVWACEYTSTQLDFFLDGTKFFTVKNTDSSLWATTFGAGKMWNIRLNVQLGSAYWGQPEVGKTANHTEYVVDYVRAWAKN